MGQNKWDASRVRSRSLLNGFASIEDVALCRVSVSELLSRMLPGVIVPFILSLDGRAAILSGDIRLERQSLVTISD